MAGWISLHRKILQNKNFQSPEKLAVWLYLLLSANHKKTITIYRGTVIILQRGQLITGRRKIAKLFKLTESKIQRILDFFEKEKQIIQHTTPNFRLITIVNYDEYQQEKSEQHIEQHGTVNKRLIKGHNKHQQEKSEQHIEHRTIINNNYNNTTTELVGNTKRGERKKEKKKITNKNLFEKLTKWLSGMEDVTYPKAFASKYFELYAEKTIKKALNDPLCTSRSKFVQLANYYREKPKKTIKIWTPPS